MVDTSLKAIQALILVPTRELALQYVTEISDIASRTDVKPFTVYGGFSIQIQTTKISHGVDILVATPGRLIDLLHNTPISLSNVRTFVLDEADEMLNMGFISDVEFIISCLIHDHQFLMFSSFRTSNSSSPASYTTTSSSCSPQPCPKRLNASPESI
jgi:ATP-dependent RNA helicase DeaD